MADPRDLAGGWRAGGLLRTGHIARATDGTFRTGVVLPTAITGFYGQNVPYPGFGQHSGFIVSCAVIIVLAGGLYAVLRRNNWL